MMKSQSTENLDAHHICERMLLALNAPVTDANIAKLGFFAGIISSMNAKTVSLEAIERIARALASIHTRLKPL